VGPRAQRRLRGGLISLAVIAAVVVAAVLLTSHAGSGSPAGLRGGGHVVGTSDRRYYKTSGKLVFGMTKQQVRRLVGPPTKTVGRCWEYAINIAYPANKNRAAFTWNADRLCFDEGRYSDSHGEFNGVWDPKPVVA
jgi:hypothetical protein